jgi:hypothetical protein
MRGMSIKKNTASKLQGRSSCDSMSMASKLPRGSKSKSMMSTARYPNTGKERKTASLIFYSKIRKGELELLLLKFIVWVFSQRTTFYKTW